MVVAKNSRDKKLGMNPKIRLAKRSDVAGMLAIYVPFILETSISFEMRVPSEDEFWGRVEKVLAKTPWLVCVINGEIAGYAYAGDHRERTAYQWNREFSAYISPKYHQRGIASAMYNSLIEIIQLQGYQNALSGITLPNDKSVGFYENFGFKSIGIYHNVGFKFGQWHSVGW
ncbi:MAG: L-amino acid N-acyltransferase YncA [Paraglaciecola sp.]